MENEVLLAKQVQLTQRDRATAKCCAYVRKFTVQFSALYFTVETL